MEDLEILTDLTASMKIKLPSEISSVHRITEMNMASKSEDVSGLLGSCLSLIVGISVLLAERTTYLN